MRNQNEGSLLLKRPAKGWVGERDADVRSAAIPLVVFSLLSSKLTTNEHVAGAVHAKLLVLLFVLLMAERFLISQLEFEATKDLRSRYGCSYVRERSWTRNTTTTITRRSAGEVDRAPSRTSSCRTQWD